MRPNFQMIVDFKDYSPKSIMYTSGEEVQKIASHFGLDKMSVLELQNLRDMVVLVYGAWKSDVREKDFEQFEKLNQGMMSITAVIDTFKYKARAEV